MAHGTNLPALAAPQELIAALTDFRDSLLCAAPDQIRSIVLYGGLARGRYRPGRSDVNVAIVSRTDSADYLDAIATILRDAFRRIRLEPFLLTESELPAAAHLFPTKLLDIRRRHVLLAGDDVFASLSIDCRDVARRVETELRNLAMRLRRRYVASAGDPRATAHALDDAAVALRVNFLAMFDLAGDPPPDDDTSAAVLTRAAERFGLDHATLAALAAVRTRTAGPEAPDARRLLASVIALASKSADTVSNMEVMP